MAAGLGFKDFTTGEVLTAADVDGYLMQGVWVFADAAARTAAVTSPQEGNISFLKDTNSTEYYSGSAWVAIGGSVPTSLEFTAGKNKIINGDMRFNQRNFSTSTGDFNFVFDRFFHYRVGGSSTVSTQTFTTGAAPVAGYEAINFAQLAVTGGTSANNQFVFTQNIEDVRTFAGQTATISFWAKAASGTPKIGVCAAQIFGSGGSPSAEVLTSGGSVTLSTSWARYSTTIAIPSISGKTIGTTANTSYLGINLVLSDQSNLYGTAIGAQSATFSIWGVQAENGSTATSFQTATGTIQGELASCQRYYWRSPVGSTYMMISNYGSASSTSTVNVNLPLKATMRTTPTAIDFANVAVSADGVASAVISVTNVTFANGNITNGDSPLLALAASGLTQYRPYAAYSNNNTNGYIGLSAEF